VTLPRPPSRNPRRPGARLLLLLCFAPFAAASETPEDYLRLARVAMEAKLREGDALLAGGDRTGALRAYADAVELFRSAERRFLKARATPGEAPDPARDAVARALDWLAAHQDFNDTGMWDCDGFMKHDAESRLSSGAGNPKYDVGVTGLALLAFLEAGHTDRAGAHARTVERGLAFLLAQQDKEGCIGSRGHLHFVHNHAAASIALCEALRATRDDKYAGPAQLAMDFCALARNPDLAWRYGVRPGNNDSSVTSWMVMAMDAGRRAGLKVDGEAFAGAMTWADRMTDEKTGQGGYIAKGGGGARPEIMLQRFPGYLSESMTASLMMVRLHCGENARSPMMAKGAERLARMPPLWWGGSIDIYYWFFATAALKQVGGGVWESWRDQLREELLRNQRPDGSFDPADPWGPDGGRVYSTALCALCLSMTAAELD